MKVPSRAARYDVVVIGAGPNGLSAAITLADVGFSVLVVEARSTPGGGARSAELTLPGFVHDVCSTVHPLALMSPYLSSLGLERHGLSFRHSAAPLAHVLSEEAAVTLERSIDATAEQLGPDRRAYGELLSPFVSRYRELAPMLLGPLRLLPRDPWLLARFGLAGLRSMQGLAASRFRAPEAPALLSGIAAHAMLPLSSAATASFALVLAIAGHAVGWPVARGGSGALTSALVSRLQEAGGEVVTDFEVRDMAQLPPAPAYVFDVTPKQLLALAGNRLPAGYRSRLERFRYGAGIFKVDWALSGPIPWRNPACARACTVHLSGDLQRVAEAERIVHSSAELPERPFVLLVQPCVADETRAPPGGHIAWAYCHVPSSDTRDRTLALESEIERFAPGFRDVILARSSKNAAHMEAYDANYVGGDINGGSAELRQLFFRPTLRLDPYSTPAPDIFLCSSSTPPGGGVHGMCGFWAARSVARRVFGQRIELPEP